jgi:hypothetical protein
MGLFRIISLILIVAGFVYLMGLFMEIDEINREIEMQEVVEMIPLEYAIRWCANDSIIGLIQSGSVGKQEGFALYPVIYEQCRENWKFFKGKIDAELEKSEDPGV